MTRLFDARWPASLLTAASWLAVVAPGVVLLVDIANRALGARPFDEVIHRTGNITVWVVVAALAITPLRRIARWPAISLVRRRVGVAAFVYAVVHLGAYVADQSVDLAKVASEIVLRFYLTIGFVALAGLAALAATSTDRMTRRLGGRRWQRLHRLVYPIGVLAIIHFFLQSKIDTTEPTLAAGFFVWLMAYRLAARRRDPGPAALVALALGAWAATLAGEAAGIAIGFGAPFLDVLAAAFDPDLGIRPAWWVLAAGLAIAFLGTARRSAGRARGRAAVAKPV